MSTSLLSRLYLSLENFNPLSPCGERHPSKIVTGHIDEFQSTLSVWRETLYAIHIVPGFPISIHSLRVERDFCIISEFRYNYKFQSTLSVWRETLMGYSAPVSQYNFNPLSPCGERQSASFLYLL